MSTEAVGLLCSVIIASTGAVGLWLKRRQDKNLDKKIIVETDALQVQIVKDVLSVVRENHAEEKAEWTQERGQHIGEIKHLTQRVQRLEKQRDLDVVSAATHRSWDDQAHALAVESDKDFPPPPPIFHGEPKLKVDAEFDTQLVIDLEGISDGSE